MEHQFSIYCKMGLKALFVALVCGFALGVFESRGQDVAKLDLKKIHYQHFRVDQKLENARRYLAHQKRVAARGPAAIAYNPNSNYRLPIERKPADAPKRYYMRTACTTSLGYTYLDGSQQYANCMDPTRTDAAITTPANYQQTGRGLAVAF